MPQKDQEVRLGDDGELVFSDAPKDELPEKPKRGQEQDEPEKPKRGITRRSLVDWFMKSYYYFILALVISMGVVVGVNAWFRVPAIAPQAISQYPDMNNTWIFDQGCNLPLQTMTDVNTTLSGLQHDGVATVYEVCKTGISNGTQWIQAWNDSLKRAGKGPTALFLVRPDASGVNKVDTFFANQSLPVSQDLYQALNKAQTYTYFNDVNGGLYQLTNMVNDTFRKYANRQ